MCSFINIICLGNSIIIYELDKENWNNETIKEQDVNLALYISSFTCVILAISLNIWYFIELRWKKAKHYVIATETFFTSGTYKYMIIETIISLIGPHFFLKDVVIHEYVKWYDTHITYKLNHILCSAVWLKCYGIVWTFLLSNWYTSAWG